MLSKKDKKWLVKEIKIAVEAALTKEITWEKVRDEKTGKPLAVIERKTEEVFLPSMLLQVLSFYEGSQRGLQEDIGKTISNFNVTKEGINAMANLLIDMESGIKIFIEASKHIQKQLEHQEAKQIES